VLGVQHTHTLITMYNLALVYLRQQRFDAAEHMMRETLALDRKVRGDRHPSTLETEYGMACILARAGKREEALATLRHAVDLGFDGAYMAGDTDLASLDGDPSFQTLVAEVKRRADAKSAARSGGGTTGDTVP
jgi:hypothetical protein